MVNDDLESGASQMVTMLDSKVTAVTIGGGLGWVIQYLPTIGQIISFVIICIICARQVIGLVKDWRKRRE